MAMAWALRPIEEVALFNPAFGALVLGRTAGSFRKQAARGLPYPLAFLVLPAVLHARTRALLPATTAAVMHTWIGEQASVLAGFPDRVRRLTPVTRESILFALTHRKLALAEGALGPGAKRFALAAAPDDATAETLQCLHAAGFLGRWFAGSGTAATVLASWGVRP